MTVGRIIRLLMLATCLVLGSLYLPHVDAYEDHLPGEVRIFLDPSSGERFREGELEQHFFLFWPAVLITLAVYLVHWIVRGRVER